MKVRQVPVEQVKPHPNNPRISHDVDRIAASIRAFGFRQPLVVWEGDGYLMVGHGRLLAARQLGLDKVPVHFVGKDELTAAEAAAYRLADNRSAEGATWEDELLLAQLDELGERERMLAGFDQAYRDELESRLAAGEDLEWRPEDEWQGMPEFDQREDAAHRTITLHFRDKEAVQLFESLVGHPLPKASYMWFPEMPRKNFEGSRYATADA